jgi:hypothetical protein
VPNYCAPGRSGGHLRKILSYAFGNGDDSMQLDPRPLSAGKNLSLSGPISTIVGRWFLLVRRFPSGADIDDRWFLLVL